jgi:hypothetical protein
MAKVHEHITDDFRKWIEKQHVFFVASAPLSADGHVNLSPKGHDCLRVLGPDRVAYLDMTGSGNETSAHLHENGRITLMWCGFEGAPRILRLYGRGRTVLPGMPEWDELIAQFDMLPGARQIIVAEIDRVQTSCGYAVPLYSYEGERDVLDKWVAAKTDAEMDKYRRDKNSESIDCLPTPLGVRLGE